MKYIRINFGPNSDHGIWREDTPENRTNMLAYIKRMNRPYYFIESKKTASNELV